MDPREAPSALEVLRYDAMPEAMAFLPDNWKAND